MRYRFDVALGALALVVGCGGGTGGTNQQDGGMSQAGTAGATPGAGGAGGSQHAGAGAPGKGGTAAGGASGGMAAGGVSITGAGSAGVASTGGHAGTATVGGSGGASTGGHSGASTGGGGNNGDVKLPPANGSYDYQIGGAYPPPAGVKVVSRDRGDAPAAGIYNICYVNGFQAQESDNAFWLDQHADLVLRDAQGKPVIDADWNEMLLDTSTAQKRQGLADIVGGWIKGCATDGFDAVEIDNLDSYSRSGARLTQANNVAFMKLISDVGHKAGLAMGQKNSTELLGDRSAMGTDFAVAEECNRYSECGDYQAVYGDLVFIIEYRDQDFTAGCKDFPGLSIVRRDVNVSTPGSASYVYKGC
jgi:Glycoside-hydrolase family GH114